MFFKMVNKELKYFLTLRGPRPVIVDKKIPYHKQYETRDFISNNNIDLQNFKNYYETEAFKKYKPNLKR